MKDLDFNIERREGAEDRGIDVALEKPYDTCPIKSCRECNYDNFTECPKYQTREERKWKL